MTQFGILSPFVLQAPDAEDDSSPRRLPDDRLQHALKASPTARRAARMQKEAVRGGTRDTLAQSENAKDDDRGTGSRGCGRRRRDPDGRGRRASRGARARSLGVSRPRHRLRRIDAHAVQAARVHGGSRRRPGGSFPQTVAADHPRRSPVSRAERLRDRDANAGAIRVRAGAPRQLGIPRASTERRAARIRRCQRVLLRARSGPALRVFPRPEGHGVRVSVARRGGARNDARTRRRPARTVHRSVVAGSGSVPRRVRGRRGPALSVFIARCDERCCSIATGAPGDGRGRTAA